MGRNSKGDIKVYKITCHGNICRDVSLQLRISRGDADLYAKEDRPPKIMDSNCNDCTCKSRGSEQFDSCSVTTQRKHLYFKKSPSLPIQIFQFNVYLIIFSNLHIVLLFLFRVEYVLRSRLCTQDISWRSFDSQWSEFHDGWIGHRRFFHSW